MRNSGCVLTVASAGNSNYDLAHKFVDATSPNDGSFPLETRTINGACLDLPAEAPGVVTVSAVGTMRLKSYYSSYGLGVVDVAAPGGDTRQPNPNVSTTANAVLVSEWPPGCLSTSSSATAARMMPATIGMCR